MAFSPPGALVSDETPLKSTGCVELKRENRRTFWMYLPRVDTKQVQRMMALRRDQPHGPRLHLCQAPNAFVCVSPNAFICHQMRLLTQRSSLRSHVFFNSLNWNSCPKSILV